MLKKALVPLKTDVKNEVELVVEGAWRGHLLVRADLLNMTRVAHHHFDYAKVGSASGRREFSLTFVVWRFCGNGVAMLT